MYWKETAESNWRVAQGLFQTGKYLEGLFLAHLTIEKFSKAHWVKDNADDYPPRIHGLARLLASTTIVHQEVVVLGSYTRNEQHEEPDIDVAIVSPDFAGGPLDVRLMAHLLARFAFSTSSRTPSRPRDFRLKSLRAGNQAYGHRGGRVEANC